MTLREPSADDLHHLRMVYGARLHQFEVWVQSSDEYGPAKMTLENQVSCYIATYPARGIPLIVALLFICSDLARSANQDSTNNLDISCN